MKQLQDESEQIHLKYADEKSIRDILDSISVTLTAHHTKKGVLEGTHLSELPFIEEVLGQGCENKYSGVFEGARKAFGEVVRHCGTNEDLMFFGEKMEMPQLIMCGDQRQEGLLVDLIIENRHKDVQTELIKRLLRENRHLSDVSSLAIGALRKQPEKVHSYHLNRFIQINSRYPHEQVESFLLDHLGCDRNSTPAKINQPFLLKDLSKLLERLPKKLGEELLLRPLPSHDREKLEALVGEIFEKLLYLPIGRFENLDMKPVNEEPVEDEDWNTESEGEEEETAALKKQASIEEGEVQAEVMEPPEIPISDSDDDDMYSGYDSDMYDHPSYLEVFTDPDRKGEAQLYRQMMLAREEIDVALDSDYDRLTPGSKVQPDKEVFLKIDLIVKLITGMQKELAEQICLKMPPALFEALKRAGLQINLSPEMLEKERKRREPVTKPPKWLGEFFSDRDESDDSDIEEGEDSEDPYDESDYNS